MRIPLALVVVAASVLGCGTVNTTRTRAAPSEDAVPKVVEVNDLLTHVFLKATEVRLSPARSGVLQAQVDVANDGFSTRSFSYLFEWLDAHGSVMPSAISTWKAASVPAGGTVMITSVAPSADATDFRLQIRRGD